MVLLQFIDLLAETEKETKLFIILSTIYYQKLESAPPKKLINNKTAETWYKLGVKHDCFENLIMTRR